MLWRHFLTCSERGNVTNFTPKSTLARNYYELGLGNLALSIVVCGISATARQIMRYHVTIGENLHRQSNYRPIQFGHSMASSRTTAELVDIGNAGVAVQIASTIGQQVLTAARCPYTIVFEV